MAIIDFDDECWDDPWVQTLPPLGKLLFTYLWTNRHCNRSGIFTITVDTISFELHLTKKQINDLWPYLESKVKYDPERSICWVLKHTRRQLLRTVKMSPRQRDGIRRLAQKFHWHRFYLVYMQMYPEIFTKEEVEKYISDTHSKGMDTHSKGMPTLKGEGEGEGEGNSFKEEIGVQREEEEEKEPTESLFERFWRVYPKKKSKGQAEKVFSKINPDEQLLETMISTIERAKKSEDWIKENGKYIPHPATWLNAKGWEDRDTELAPPTDEIDRRIFEIRKAREKDEYSKSP